MIVRGDPLSSTGGIVYASGIFYEMENYLEVGAYDMSPLFSGVIHGSDDSPITSVQPTLKWQRFDVSDYGAYGTTISYMFETFTKGGTQKARYNLVGMAHGQLSATGAGNDVVGTAGLAWCEGECAAWGLYGEGTLWDLNGMIFACELDAVNAFGGIASRNTDSGAAGKSYGCFIEGKTLGDGSQYNTAAIIIDAQEADGRFYDGIVFSPSSVLERAIDLSYLPSTVIPILIANDAYIQANNYAGTGKLNVMKVLPSDTFHLHINTGVKCDPHYEFELIGTACVSGAPPIFRMNTTEYDGNSIPYYPCKLVFTPSFENSPGNYFDVYVANGYAFAATEADRQTLAMRLTGAGCVGIGLTSFGTSAARVFGIGNGTAPSSSPADAFQMYSADQAAGNACPHFRTESGTVIKLFQQTHIADATDAATVITRCNAILQVLENLGFLATS